MAEWLIYLALGAFAGTLAGMLGVGGGLVIVPVLAWAFAGLAFDQGVIMHLAVGTSLATIVFTSLSSVRAHHRRGAVRWPAVWQLLPGIVLGVFLGALLAAGLPTAALRNVFGVFELLVAAQMGFSLLPEAHRALPGRIGMSAAGTVIGGVSAIVGIGGGTLTVPFLLWCGVAMRQAVATSAACGLPIAVAGAVAFAWTGSGNAGLPAQALGYLYLPALFGIAVSSILFAPLGAWLAHSLPTTALKRFFALFLALLGVRMLME
ncbi:sulfite exporter TauE/SafE family protein [Sulfurivermis fontis]|uniref:sulfite exporter TauE/SafE family protein n=1 Tax=Sulfurivermis fontis TaxID=1972068 RepID=UPI000FD6F94C|nr:sulfite exporter TauE/SafE family protein [Sulfurivermis fontis]